LTTKLHMASDALGLPLRILATPGNRNDITQAADLLEGFRTGHVIADKGYDGETAIAAVRKAGAVPVIPRRKMTAKWRPFDRVLYRERHLIEGLFGKLKQFRRIATRYDKHIQNYLGFVKIAAIAIWIR
jgi:putative transposase